MVNSSPCLYLYSLVPPDHLGLQPAPISFSEELLLILQSPARCHLLCEAPWPTSFFVPSAFCSSAVSLPKTVSQSALSWLLFPTVSLLRAGALLGCREGAAQARAARGGTLEEALWQWGDPSMPSVERAVWAMLDEWFEATSLNL